MEWRMLEAKFSTPRMLRYLRSHDGEKTRAIQAYIFNMRIAEALVSIFHVFEIALRNGVHKELSIAYRRDDWYEAWGESAQADLRGHYQKVSEVKAALSGRCVSLTPDNIIAALSFGFWTSLFNRRTFRLLSKPLMRVFFHCPTSGRNPDNIRARLNRSRDLRNRCFHHEPLIWQPLFKLHGEICDVIQWIDPVLQRWARAHDRAPLVLREWTQWREAAA